ncbi:hypothetical protein [Streptosporangium sp. NPDC020145]|uniref:hypothetical protein n=1 Tax=Streptosporangium sp. NPDC020145 TaxID=3154694 RepID=UPI00343AD3A1
MSPATASEARQGLGEDGVMIAPSGPRSAAEIRDYLTDRLNSALRRPGMFGGETALLLLLDHLVYAENQDDAWEQERRAMESRGAFTSIGVTGAFRTLLPNSEEHGPASVYAEFAHVHGWLRADRVLTAEEHESVRQESRTWVGQDRLFSEVVETFGPPSVLFGGSNPFYGKTLGYLTEQVNEPMIFFHLWNGTDPDAASTWPPLHSEPVLLAVRHGRGRFRDTFIFSPEGRKRRPVTE